MLTMILSRRSKVLALVVAFVLAVFALRLSWGLYGAEMFGTEEAGAQGETGTCPEAQLIDTFTGTGNQESDTFQTTTDSFRITYDLSESERTVADVEPSLFITVNNQEEGLPVANATQDGAGSGETFVNEPPGTYFLDIATLFGEYDITVEQCEGGDPSRGDGGEPKGQGKAPPPPPPPPPPPGDGELMKAGGPEDGPLPKMPGGGCPEEFPVEKAKGCYR